jgi:hypothetical protein
MALSDVRDTPRLGQAIREVYVPQKGSTTIYAGALVVANAGYAAPGTTATGLVAIGRAMETSVNSGADGAKSVRVEQGIYLFKNAGGDPITIAATGALVYITDDETVNITATGKSAAGKFVGFGNNGADTGFAWVLVQY